MNVNLQPKTPATSTVSDWLQYGSNLLSGASITSARLDSEVLLMHLLGVPRTYLHGHPERLLSPRQAEIYLSMLELRHNRVPVAYITGHKQFYGRSFHVTPSVLIPRPESEEIINLLKAMPAFKTLLDIGCGSGCLGVSAQCELPDIEVTLADISSSALAVARKNADKYKSNIKFIQSDLLASIGSSTFDVIIANLPYVDRTWQTSAELQYEPPLALYAQDAGLELILRLLKQAPVHLNKGGRLLLESDPVQHATIISQAKKHGLKHIQTVDYITVFTLS